MGYTNKGAKMKLWDPHTKKLKYCSSTKFDEHSNKFGKLRSLCYEPITGVIFYTLPTFKIDLSGYPFIKDGIFEVTVNFPPRGTPIGDVV